MPTSININHALSPSSNLILECEKVKFNIDLLKKKLPENGRLMAMIKAYGYGQDGIKLSKLLSSFGIDIFGVAHPEEGIELRQEGAEEDIFVIHAMPNQVEACLRFNLQVGVSSFELVEELEKQAEKLSTTAKVHLHIDTGMTRFGVPADMAVALGKKIGRSKYLEFEGLMTHLASSDDAEQDPFTFSQMNQLESVFQSLRESGLHPKWVHAANSAGLVRHAQRFNMARVGLSLFGIGHKESLLSPAISLMSRLGHIHDCKRGDTVSYHRGYRVLKERERIGVVLCGYHDGVPRSISGKGYASIRGKQAPYVGIVCMDYLMIDLTDIPEAEAGDEVLLFGGDIPLEQFSAWSGTIAHEILTRMSGRVGRIYT